MNFKSKDYETVSVDQLGFYDGFFTTWSPEAEKVTVLLFKNSAAVKENKAAEEISLQNTEKGLWKNPEKIENISDFKYYKYRFTFKNEEYEICDIWSKCAAPDSLASKLTDINKDPAAIPENFSKKYFNPFAASEGENHKKYTDAFIYEMHVRDFSRAFKKDSTGKFLDIAKAKKLMKHLKELGVTHVQLLPCFDYANTNDDLSYNWGYDPFNYNVPEGRYVTAGYKDGTQAVKEFRQMIQAFHDNGIAVNMDVVYNHTNGTGKYSIYDMTFPKYFYRLDEKGNYMNGSGCSNEVATNHQMVRAFVIDSLKHWMKDYHINGFRFDLMGLQETSTMKEIYNELRKIDPDVMVYGEPWTGGVSGVVNGCLKENIDDCCENVKLNGVACFNDNFRNAVKGPEFGGFGKGQVQGEFYDELICSGLTGSVRGKGSFTKNPCRTINYAECHDNYALFDKLAISYMNKTSGSGDLYSQIGEEGLKTVKKWNVLCAGFVLLSQGIPFINGGQEFMRTKQGDENSFNSSDEINQIDFDFKKKNGDVFKVYKGLSALRHQNPDAFGCNADAQAETQLPGITKYKTKNFEIYFNATKKNYYAKGIFLSKIDVSSGAVKEKMMMQELTLHKTLIKGVKIPAEAFVILRTE